MGKKKILIADDETDILKVLEKRLETAGYAVVAAENGNDAIRLAKSERPDLILLDINMPGMDGAEAKKILKDEPSTKKIPVIFLTALITKKEEISSGHKIGDNFFIAKPYDYEELLRQIKRHLPD